MKFLLWAAIVLVLVMWLLRGKKTLPGTGAADTGNVGDARNGAEPMIQCAHCRIHVPASESIVSASGAVFCSEEHRLRHVGP